MMYTPMVINDIQLRMGMCNDNDEIFVASDWCVNCNEIKMVPITGNQQKLSSKAKTELYRSTYDGYSLENIDMDGNVYRANMTFK